MFWIGIYPKPLFRVLERPVQQIVEQVNPGYYGAERADAPAVIAAPVPEQGDAMPGMPGMSHPQSEVPDDDLDPRQMDPRANGNGKAAPVNPGKPQTPAAGTEKQ